MRRRSLTGPLLLLIIGGLFLWRNLHPEAPVFETIAQYWPFLLIFWGFLRLVEVFLWRESRQGGFTGGEVLLVVLICIAGSLMWVAHENGIRINARGLDWWGSQYDYPVAASAPAGSATRIVFEDARGSIKVTGADTKDVTVNGHKTIRAYERQNADRTNGNTAVEIAQEGDRLLIRTNLDRAPDNQQVTDDLEVTVPRSMGVEAHSHNADCEIADVSGDVELNSDRGDVRLSRIGGNARLNVGRSDLVRAVDLKGGLNLEGRGSDVELENIGGQVTIKGAFNGTLDFKRLAKPVQFEGARGTVLSAQAVPGSVSMDLSEFHGSDLVGPVRFEAQSRDVRIEQFTQSLELDVQRGDVELHPGRVPLPSIDAHSGVGRIDLALPENASFQLDATAERGEAVNDFGPAVRQESEGRSATLKGKVGQGPSIHLTSGRGTVAVRKEGSASRESGEKPLASPERLEKQLKNLKEVEIK